MKFYDIIVILMVCGGITMEVRDFINKRKIKKEPELHIKLLNTYLNSVNDFKK